MILVGKRFVLGKLSTFQIQFNLISGGYSRVSYLN